MQSHEFKEAATMAGCQIQWYWGWRWRHALFKAKLITTSKGQRGGRW